MRASNRTLGHGCLIRASGSHAFRRTAGLILTIGIRSRRQPGISAKGPVRRSTSARLGQVQGFATLLADLGTICLNTIAPADPALPGFRLITTPTALQRQAFELLGVSHRLGAA